MMTATDNRLDYIQTVANRFCPHIEYVSDGNGNYIETREDSYATYHFASRLENGSINEDVKTVRYDANDELQKMIQARGIDTEKLWYLILWIRDYILDIGVESSNSPMKELRMFIDALGEANPDDSNVAIRIMTGKKCLGKLTSTEAKSLLYHILHDWKLSQNSFSIALLFSSNIPEYESVGSTVANYIFYTMMDSFLSGCPIKDKSIKLRTKDTKFFISSLIYASGLSDDKLLADPNKSNGNLQTSQHLNGVISNPLKIMKGKTLHNHIYDSLLQPLVQ